MPWLVVGVVVGTFLDATLVQASWDLLELPVTPSKVAAGALLIAVLGRERRLVPNPLTGPLLAVVAAMVLSAVNGGWGPAWRPIAGVGLLAVLVHAIHGGLRPDQVRPVLRGAGWALGLAMVFALVTQRGGVDAASLDIAWRDRATGPFADANAWATAVLTLGPLCAVGLDDARDRWLSNGLMVLMPAVLMQTASRAAVLVLVLSLPLWVWAVRGRVRWLGAGVVLACLLAPWLVNVTSLGLRWSALADPSIETGLRHGSLVDRAALFGLGWQLFLDHPLLGVGVGGFPHEAVAAGLPFKVAHNSYLNVAAEQGGVGVAAHLALGAAVVREVWVARRHPVGRGYAVGLVGFGLMAATLNLATFNLFWVATGLLLVVGKR